MANAESLLSARPAAPSWRAFLSLGFRPLYLAGCAWALISVLLWVYTPHWLPDSPLPGAYWHAHEMLWGFIGTIAVGFLLTASATWTGINPLRGPALGLLCVAWAGARAGYLSDSLAGFWLGFVCEFLFFAGAGTCLMRVITRGNSLRNVGLPWLVLALGISNALFLAAAAQGRYLHLMTYFDLGLLCMAVITLLIARRVIPFFAMRRVPGLQIPMQVRSGQVQLGLSCLAIALGLAGWPLAMAPLLACVGAVSLWQLARWRPLAVRAVPMLWILYLGYAALGLGLLLAALHLSGLSPGPLNRPAWHVHLIGMGGFSVLIIGMVTRTSLGHLGRPLALDRSMLASYVLMLLAVVLRLAALWPSSATLALLHSAALCWALSLGFFLWRFTPMLVRPRCG